MLAESLKLEEQAFAQVACTDAEWFKAVKQAQDIFDALKRYLEIAGYFAGADFKIAAFIEVADELFCNQFVIGRGEGFELAEEDFGERFSIGDGSKHVKFVVAVDFSEAIVVEVIELQVNTPRIGQGVIIERSLAHSLGRWGSMPTVGAGLPMKTYAAKLTDALFGHLKGRILHLFLVDGTFQFVG